MGERFLEFTVAANDGKQYRTAIRAGKVRHFAEQAGGTVALVDDTGHTLLVTPFDTVLAAFEEVARFIVFTIAGQDGKHYRIAIRADTIKRYADQPGNVTYVADDIGSHVHVLNSYEEVKALVEGM